MVWPLGGHAAMSMTVRKPWFLNATAIASPMHHLVPSVWLLAVILLLLLPTKPASNHHIALWKILLGDLHCLSFIGDWSS